MSEETPKEEILDPGNSLEGAESISTSEKRIKLREMRKMIEGRIFGGNLPEDQIEILEIDLKNIDAQLKNLE